MVTLAVLCSALQARLWRRSSSPHAIWRSIRRLRLTWSRARPCLSWLPELRYQCTFRVAPELATGLIALMSSVLPSAWRRLLSLQLPRRLPRQQKLSPIRHQALVVRAEQFVYFTSVLQTRRPSACSCAPSLSRSADCKVLLQMISENPFPNKACLLLFTCACFNYVYRFPTNRILVLRSR